MRDLTPAYRYEIDGRNVLVYDNVVCRADQRPLAIVDARSAHAIRFAESGLEVLDGLDCALGAPRPRRTDEIKRRMLAGFPSSKLVLDRAYLNSNAFGDATSFHRDFPDPSAVTGLLYVNDYWEPAWGGETVFLNSRDDAVVCVTPRPGRAVIFSAELAHRGTPPSRQCLEARIVLAFKFIPKAGNRRPNPEPPCR
jgi:hypothetical protein